MKPCIRCGAKPQSGKDILDFCAKCGTTLCEACMAEGCCGYVPAISGTQEALLSESMTWEKFIKNCKRFEEVA